MYNLQLLRRSFNTSVCSFTSCLENGSESLQYYILMHFKCYIWSYLARIGERLLPAYFPQSSPFFSFLFSLFPIKSLEQANHRQIPRLAFTANGKRELYHVTKFSIYFNWTKIGRLTPILSIRIVLSRLYLLITHFEIFSTTAWIWSRLLFAVNAMLNFSYIAAKRPCCVTMPVS